MLKRAFNSNTNHKLINSNIQKDIGKILEDYHGIQVFDTLGTDPDYQFVTLYEIKDVIILRYNTEYNYLDLVIYNNKKLHDQIYDQFVMACPDVDDCQQIK